VSRSLAEEIGRLIEGSRLDQTEIARRAEVSDATISELKRGKKGIRTPTARAILRALEVPAHEADLLILRATGQLVASSALPEQSRPEPLTAQVLTAVVQEGGAHGEGVEGGALWRTTEAPEPDPTDDFSGDTLEFANLCAEWALGEAVTDIPEGMPVGLLALKLKWGRHLGRDDFAMLHSLADSRQHARRAQLARRWPEATWEEVWFRLTRNRPPVV